MNKNDSMQQSRLDRQKSKRSLKKRKKRIAQAKGKDLVYQLSKTIDHFFSRPMGALRRD